MVLKVNEIFRIGTLSILALVFLLGGFIQYFIGIPTTLYTLLVTSLLYVLLFFDFLLRLKLLVNKVILTSLALTLIILLSGFINRTDLAAIALYVFFGLIPLGIFYLFEILARREITIKKDVENFFRFIVFIQLPLIIVQKFGYNFLIRFNNSNQAINDYDFMFGSFFIRADHALGFFLLIYLLKIFINLKRSTYTKVPWLMIGYISLTIILMGSNLTKLFLLVVFTFYLLVWLYRKVSLLGILIMLLPGYLMFKVALTVPAIAGEYNNFKRNYSVEQSIVAYEGTYAKRPQVAIVYLTQIPLKIIGEGPYDYYDILKGTFKKSKHFSQMIWSYNDLGIIGLTTFIILAAFIPYHLSLSADGRLLLFALLLFYLFMTNVFYDLAMGLSLLIIHERIK